MSLERTTRHAHRRRRAIPWLEAVPRLLGKRGMSPGTRSCASVVFGVPLRDRIQSRSHCGRGTRTIAGAGRENPAKSARGCRRSSPAGRSASRHLSQTCNIACVQVGGSSGERAAWRRGDAALARQEQQSR
jgi:hypothetical protein